VGNLSIRRMCQEQTIIAVNGSLPGPTLQVTEDDTLVIHVVNKSPYNYTYKFKVTKHEGTLWWHAHTSFMRATVYGALIIRPRAGEWWNANVMDVERIGMAIGGVPNVSDAYSINGRLGDLSPFSNKRKHKVTLLITPH
ncbi:hypothetical protein MKW98_006816, partial [Papaver atlanticum]